MSSPSAARHTTVASMASDWPLRASSMPGSPSQPVVDGSDVGAGQEPGQGRLPAAATAPDLGDHAAAGDRRASGETFALDQRDDVTVTAFDGNECADI